MDTNSEAYGDAVNAALANLLEHAKLDSKMTYPDLVEKTGISIATLKRLFGNHRTMSLPQFFAIASALGEEPLDLMRQAEEAAKSV